MKLVSRLLFATGGHILPDSHLYLPPHLCCSCCTNAKGRLPVVVVRNPFSRLASNWRTLNSATSICLFKKDEMCFYLAYLAQTFLPTSYINFPKLGLKHLQRSFNLLSLPRFNGDISFAMGFTAKHHRSSGESLAILVEFSQVCLFRARVAHWDYPWHRRPGLSWKPQNQIELEDGSLMSRWKTRLLYKAILFWNSTVLLL